MLGETGIIDPAEHTTARHNTHFSSHAKIFRVNELGSGRSPSRALVNAYQGIHNSRKTFKLGYVQSIYIYFPRVEYFFFFFSYKMEMGFEILGVLMDITTIFYLLKQGEKITYFYW